MGMVTDRRDDHVVDAMRRELTQSPITAGELMERTRFTGAPLVRRREALLAILSSGNALAKVPLGMIVDETLIYDLAMVPAETTAQQVRRIIGPVTRVEKLSGAMLRVWVLHRMEGTMPTHTPPHRLRESVNPMRPTGLALPFTRLEPGERLEMRAEFRKGLLTTYRLTVET